MMDNRREGKDLRLSSNTHYAFHRRLGYEHSQLGLQLLGSTGVGQARFPR